MTESILVDNDIIIKTCCYSLAENLSALICVGDQEILRLGVAEYVIHRYFQRARGIRAPEKAAGAAKSFLATAAKLEPTEPEIELAAEIEDAALKAGVSLDTGESQLIAVLIKRQAKVLLTGDKRAISAAHSISSGCSWSAHLEERFACLEQVIHTLGEELGILEIASRVCAEPQADRALSICFSCSFTQKDEKTISEGLTSYLNHIRSQSGKLLVPGPSLLPVIA